MAIETNHSFSYREKKNFIWTIERFYLRWICETKKKNVSNSCWIWRRHFDKVPNKRFSFSLSYPWIRIYEKV